MANLSLGIDLGVNSLGTALIEREKHKIRFTGVRIFPAGVVGDIESGKDESRAVKRRQMRLQRRQAWRRVRRLKKTLHLLQRYGLLPAGEAACAIPAVDSELHARYPQTEILPYFLRARALDYALTAQELGRALYHLAQRRGFLSNRRAPEKKDKDKGKVKGGIESLEGQIAGNGKRTLGEYLASLDPHEARIRTRYTHRSMFEREFAAIWEAQRVHHPMVLTESRFAELREALFFQRPLKDQRHLIGQCSLMPELKRAPVYWPEIQRWRYIQAINNLILMSPAGEERALTEREREILYRECEGHEKIAFKKAKKLIGVTDSWKFTIESGGEKDLKGNLTNVRLGKILNLRWQQLTADRQIELLQDWAKAETDDEAFRTLAQEKWECSPDEARALSDLRLPDAYANVSLEAARRILTHLERGVTYGEARKLEFPEQFVPKEPLALLPPVKEALPEVRNPAVMRALTEMRKTVNAIIRKFGKPDYIHIELGRDLKRNRDERMKLSSKNREREKQREQAREALQAHGLPEPKGSDIEKYLLWQECGKTCPYTGQSISLNSIFGANPMFDVEHIVPFSRSLDDSFLNKTLCYKPENANKGNRTPWERYGGTAQFDEMIERVKRFGNDAKLRRFQMRETDLAKLLADFNSRQLNDTRYASRLAQQYLGLLYGGRSDASGTQRVFVSNGQATAFLRQKWDLNRILSDSPQKSRDDHRHHAVDAAAAAMASPRMLQALARAAENAVRERHRRFGSFAHPWPEFREQLSAAIKATNVSHRPMRKLGGPLHEETLYGKPHTGRDGKNYVHIRVLVEKADIEEIVDPTVREAVRTAREAKVAPVLTTRDGRSIPIRKVRVRSVVKTVPIGEGARRRNVVTGDNHHMEVIGETKGTKVVYSGAVVSRLEAAQRNRLGIPVVQRDHGADKEFLFSLSEGDMVEWQGAYWRVRGVTTQSNGMPILSPSTDARLKADAIVERPTVNVFCKGGGRKVLIDHLGEVRLARD
jgi:CRISPR-associated endonuclease Csn1